MVTKLNRTNYQVRAKMRNRSKLVEALRTGPGQTFDELLKNEKVGMSRGALSVHLRELEDEGRLEKKWVKRRLCNYLTELGTDPTECLISKLVIMSDGAIEKSSLTELSTNLTHELVKAIGGFCSYATKDEAIREAIGRSPDALDPNVLNLFFANYAAELEDLSLLQRTKEENRKKIEESRNEWTGAYQKIYDEWARKLSEVAKQLEVHIPECDLRVQYWDEGLFQKVVQGIEARIKDLDNEFAVLAFLGKYNVSQYVADRAFRSWIAVTRGIPSLAVTFHFIRRETHRVKVAKCILLEGDRITAFYLAESERGNVLNKKMRETAERISSQAIEQGTMVRVRRGGQPWMSWWDFLKQIAPHEEPAGINS